MSKAAFKGELIGAVLAAVALAAGPVGAEDEAELLVREINYQLSRAEILEQSVIVVRADGQRVVLEGRVRSRQLIDQAGRIAAGVDGVEAVDNRLKVADAPHDGGGGGGNSHLPKGEPAEAVTPAQGNNQQDTEQPENQSGQGGTGQESE